MVCDRERIVISDGYSIDLFEVNAYSQLFILLWNYHYGAHTLSMFNLIDKLRFQEFINLLSDFPGKVIIICVWSLLTGFSSVVHGDGMLAYGWINSL